MRVLILSNSREARVCGVRAPFTSTVQPLPGAQPLAAFEAAGAFFDDRMYWSSPDGELTLVALGAVLAIEPAGPTRFQRAADEWRRLCRYGIKGDEAGIPGTGPLLMGGFAFDPLSAQDAAWSAFGDSRLVIPQVLVTTTPKGSWLTVNGSQSDPDLPRALEFLNSVSARDCSAEHNVTACLQSGPGEAQRWQNLVRSVRTTLQRNEETGGALQKVVLARQANVTANGAIQPGAVLARLSRAYPDCYVFAVARGASCFLGATPERLIRLHKGRVQASSLAGTVRRGANETDDERLRQQLLQDPKERHEHRIVAETLAQGLQQAGVDLDVVPDAPVVVSLRNVHHLYTPLEGSAPKKQLLDLIGAVHPTPAMGGYPREDAMQVIRQVEGFDRGWYAAPVGWTNNRGEGEFAVAIRSALLTGTEARLFAGCGIMADSDPSSEYAESQLKLQPMLAALGVSA